MKTVSILGSTGSVGRQALDVIRTLEGLRIVALATGSRWEEALYQAKEFGAECLAIEDPLSAGAAVAKARQMGLERLQVVTGAEGLHKAAILPDVEVVLHAVPGFKGIPPLIDALSSGKTVALAGKEALVSAGELIAHLKNTDRTNLIPVDSEHSAIFQCIAGHDRRNIAEVILTASGGALRDLSLSEMRDVSPDQVLKHPTWVMGPKITVDSATLFNKTLEVMEVKHLFDVDYDRIKVVVHRQSIVHSMVTFRDGSTIAQAAVPDMRLPIAYALVYPQRADSVVPSLSPYVGTLTFEEPDTERFPCLTLGYEAGRLGGTAPCVLSYADELLVKRFLERRIRITDIYPALKRMLDMHKPEPVDSLEALERAKSFVDSVISTVMP